LLRNGNAAKRVKLVCGYSGVREIVNGKSEGVVDLAKTGKGDHTFISLDVRELFD
jgi:hypothetical protein